MKKILFLTLSFGLLVAFSACQQQNPPVPDGSSQQKNLLSVPFSKGPTTPPALKGPNTAPPKAEKLK